MAEKIGKDDQMPSPARTSSGSTGVVIPGSKETIENTTSTTSGSVSPKLPIARIFRYLLYYIKMSVRIFRYLMDRVLSLLHSIAVLRIPTVHVSLHDVHVHMMGYMWIHVYRKCRKVHCV